MLPGQNGNSCTSVETRKTRPARADRRVDVGRRERRVDAADLRAPTRRGRRPARRPRCAGGAARVWPCCMPRAMRVQHARAPAARARTRGRPRAAARGCGARSASSPIDREQHDDDDAAEGEDQCSKRAGTFTNGSCSSMITTSAIASTICSATHRAGERRVRHVDARAAAGAAAARRRAPISPRRAGSSVLSRKPMKSAGTTWRVEEARVVRDRVERRLPDGRLEHGSRPG